MTADKIRMLETQREELLASLGKQADEISVLRSAEKNHKIHVPVAHRDHSDAWIECSCGWGSFGTDGGDWLAHFYAELLSLQLFRGTNS